MIVQLERITSREGLARRRRCTVPRCLSIASWFLVDRDYSSAADGSPPGEMLCCTEHIAATYLSLRGADVIARAAAAQADRGPERRRTERHTSMESVISDSIAGLRM
jgi:hypothetical protein